MEGTLDFPKGGDSMLADLKHQGERMIEALRKLAAKRAKDGRKAAQAATGKRK